MHYLKRLAPGWFLRIVIFTGMMMFVVFTIFVVVVHAWNPHPSCLRTETSLPTAIITYIDPKSSATFTFRFDDQENSSELSQIEYASAFSPDGRRLAYLRDLNRNGVGVITFTVPQFDS